MAKITFIFGLSGSGKTYHAKELLKESDAIIFDEGFNTNFEDNYMVLLEHLKEGKDYIIIEMEYRSHHNQKVIQQMLAKDVPEVEIQWHFFENDIEKANKNLLKRTNKGDVEKHMEINSRITKDYEIPVGVEALPIVTDW